MEWHEAITQIQPYVVRISTPQGSGTGWLVSLSNTSPLCAIATAAHVIDHAHYWEQPIRITHANTGKSILLHASERAINIEPKLDLAGIVFERGEILFPDPILPLIEKDKYYKPGVEIGWLGFPAIPKAGLCFFSGRVSSYLMEDSLYFVDGVAINGVSGGPAFTLGAKSAQLMGVVSAYIPNLATGNVLPGVAVVQDVAQFHDLAERFRSFDDAKAKESPPGATPPLEPDSGAPKIEP